MRGIRPPYHVAQLNTATPLEIEDFRARLLAGDVYAVDDDDKRQIAAMAARVGCTITGYVRQRVDLFAGEV